MTTEEARELELLTLRGTLRTENGRAFLWRCLSHCGTFTVPNHGDPLKSAFVLGMRTHGVWLDRELREASMDDYLLMLKEHHDGC